MFEQPASIFVTFPYRYSVELLSIFYLPNILYNYYFKQNKSACKMLIVTLREVKGHNIFVL